jgi:hypothetical protein
VEPLAQKTGLEQEFGRGRAFRRRSVEIGEEGREPGWTPVWVGQRRGLYTSGAEILPGSAEAVTELDELVKRYVGRTLRRGGH